MAWNTWSFLVAQTAGTNCPIGSICIFEGLVICVVGNMCHTTTLGLIHSFELPFQQLLWYHHFDTDLLFSITHTAGSGAKAALLFLSGCFIIGPLTKCVHWSPLGCRIES